MRLSPIIGACGRWLRPAECAAVVKADAYGLGMAQAAPALARTGCKTFFVATLGEGKALRQLLPDATIYVFAGLMPGTAGQYRKHALRPVLNSAEEIKEWAAFSASRGERLACAVHIDSGMNRLGLLLTRSMRLRQREIFGPLLAVAGDESPRLRRRAQTSEE
jgi:alanine racemase